MSREPACGRRCPDPWMTAPGGLAASEMNEQGRPPPTAAPK